MERTLFYFVMLNSFSCAGLRLSIHHAPNAAAWDEKWTLKQVQGDDEGGGGFICDSPPLAGEVGSTKC